MANDKDKPTTPEDPNDALVKSLESIRALLAKSEGKLSAARESLDLARPKTKPANPEMDVPVLDDIVIPGHESGYKPATKKAGTETNQTLEQVKQDILQVIQTELDAGFAALRKDLHNRLEQEITALKDRLKKS